MVRNWRSNRPLFLFVSLFFCFGLMALSQFGLLSPVENIVSIPLNVVSRFMTDMALSAVGGVTDLAELQDLRQRNADLEEALAQFQVELVELREIASDYERLAELLDYTTAAQNQEMVAADVINVDQTGLRRTITINRGTRDGITVGMPVVTAQGLIGRILDVSATASRVLLITDRDSAVSARLQSSRAQGSVVGQLSGNLRMTMIPLGAPVQTGDLVITSGLGGNFPADIVIGVVTSIRQFDFELFQEAEVTSLNNFDTLEFVLVITGFEPVDLSVFEEPAE
ncbi:MAG: rod shape-determining protein MreC [Anaerolineaceae bacterium]|nr:rod shape-determining protein MreC [Anaerolineaceae bacterium]